MRRITTVGVALAMTLAGAVPALAEVGEPGPVYVSDPSKVPHGALLAGEVAGENCTTEVSWAHATPGQEHEAVTHAEYRYLREVPAVQEESHLQYRWEVEGRAYDPGLAEVSHQTYSYVKDVPDFTTEHEYVKEVKGKVQWDADPRGKRQHWVDDSTFDWEVWNGGSSTQWSADLVDVLESGPHSALIATWVEGAFVKIDWRKVSTRYRYVPTGATRQVPDGSHQEFSGEVTDPLDAPWVLLDGYPKKVVTQEYEAPSFTDWTYTGVTDWQDSDVAPADPDGQDGQDNPLNLVRLGSMLTSDPIIDVVAVPGYTEFYVQDGEPSRDRDEASWVTTAPQGWVQFDQRTVVDTEAWVDEPVVTIYTWVRQDECPVTPPAEPPAARQSPPVLAETGPGDYAVAGWIVVGLLGLGVVAYAYGNRRRRQDEQDIDR